MRRREFQDTILWEHDDPLKEAHARFQEETLSEHDLLIIFKGVYRMAQEREDCQMAQRLVYLWDQEQKVEQKRS